MKKTPKISVVIPSFNKAKYIHLTLDSIFKQKYPNLEVIIQDGGSNDGTIEVIKEFAQKYLIIWESKTDNGQLDAVNQGLAKSSGDILTYINADDCYKDDAFNKVAEAYVKNPKALWFAGRGVVINSDNQEIAKIVTAYKNILLNLNLYSFLLATNYLMQPSVFFTHKAYERFGPFSGTVDFIMEYGLWLEFGKSAMPVVINKILSRFRIEPSTKTKTMFDKLLFEDWKIVKKFTRNPLILLVHKLNNVGRIFAGRFV